MSNASAPPEFFATAIMWALILSVIRFVSTEYILKPLGSHIVTEQGRQREGKVSKFATCSFKASFFIVITYFEYTILSQQSFTPSYLFGSGHTINLWTENYRLTSDLISLFMASLGYHLHSTIYHCFLVERRSDFGEMLLHHALTLWLMVLSYIEGFQRIGLLIVFLNDAPDIFVYLTKALGDTVYVRSSILSYIGLIISYFYFRLVVFPVSLLPSLLFESNMHMVARTLYVGFLSTLTLLHAYWFVLILRIGVNLIKTGKRQDFVVDRKVQ
jgi:hypothetical protein